MKLIDFIHIKEKVDTSNWKQFKISDIFPKLKIKKYSKIPRDEGDVAFISSQSTNNGVAKYCNLNTNLRNAITVSTNGSNFDCFYHDYNFVPSSDVEVLFNNKLNKYNSLFLCSILQKEKYKYDYNKKAKNGAVFETIIRLPAINDNTPDWEYMEKYIKYIYIYILKNICKISNSINMKEKINESNWKEFKIDELFNIYSSKNSLDKNKIIFNKDFKNNINYITRQDINNGVNAKICSQNTNINEGNCLTIGLDTQTVFYQSEEFYTGQNIHILRMDGANKYHYLFIATIIRKKIKEIYSWGGNGATLGRLKEEKIKLPSCDNVPDLKYMEKFIKSLKCSKYL